MKRLILLILSSLILANAHAQIPDDTNGRLYLLCKTWGYVKYFSQQKCGAPWDDLLNTTINEVLESGNNADFNTAIMDMMNQVGNNRPVTDQGVMPDTNLLTNTEWLNDQAFSTEVKSFLSTFSSNIYPDQSTCLVRFNEYGNPDAYGRLDFTQDPFYLTIDYTIESNRLTVMFYYWNVINYFFPYRNLMDHSWDSTLLEFIPVFRNSRNEAEFQINFLKLVTRINDSHGSVSSSVLTNSFWKGLYLPKIAFKRIENQCVVTKLDGIEGVRPGDILTEFDGKPIIYIEDSLALFTPSSTPAALYRDIYNRMTRGPENSEINMTFNDASGYSYQITLTRTTVYSTWSAWESEKGSSASYSVTNCGYGYINMDLLMPDEVPAMYEALKSTPAIIVDLRNYPKINLRDFAPLFFDSPIESAIFFTPALTWILENRYYLPGYYYKYTDITNLGTWTNPAPYPGKIFILVNQEAQSGSEYFCQYLSYHPNAKVIGTQTAGADGNITRIKLPGGIYTSFTSLGTYYADGYQQQRNGVKIDSIVAPTIQGIREGKDEILLAVLDCLSGIENHIISPFNVSVFPNPVSSGKVQVSFTLEQHSEVSISLIDITGKMIQNKTQQFSGGEQTLVLDLVKAAPGFYILKIHNEKATNLVKILVQ